MVFQISYLLSFIDIDSVYINNNKSCLTLESSATVTQSLYWDGISILMFSNIYNYSDDCILYKYYFSI